eukprot:TRINITY_DN18199_c0_g1_i2.p3 TRINITY_DN18199_c0_g1~~TRINITY_DN18199_c0_g1_i2.p3  ORF type:complete len:100 (-),score=10.52 TRINITY_DN18199_c0_g1_i2:98-397(-)
MQRTINTLPKLRDQLGSIGSHLTQLHKAVGSRRRTRMRGPRGVRRTTCGVPRSSVEAEAMANRSAADNRVYAVSAAGFSAGRKEEGMSRTAGKGVSAAG